jgi:HSP20 family protein
MNDLRTRDLFALDPFDEGLRTLMRPWRPDLPEIAPRIRLDVSETDGEYAVKAEIPGVRKEDIDVRIDGRQVTISAETRTEKEEKDGGRMLRQERRQGFASRAFTLSCPVDPARAEASYRDGVLELKLPKAGGSAGQRLSVR